MAKIRWQRWTDSEPSVSEDPRPSLVFVRGPACQTTRRLDDELFGDADLADRISAHWKTYDTAEEDAAAVAERLESGGWPALVFLDERGSHVAAVTNLTVASARRHLLRHLGTVAESDALADSAALDAFSPRIIDAAAQTLLDSFDRSSGGFGTGQKFPHPEVLDFAILHGAKTDDPAYGELVQRTLTSMAQGALFDRPSGGFFRYCGTRDWREPHTEMPLDIQAGLLRNYLEASQLFERPDFRKVALQQLSYLEHHLRDAETGGYFGSQDQDDAYYSLSEQARRDRKPPMVETKRYTHSTAQVASSLLKASVVLGDTMLRDHALAAIHFLLEHSYRPGRGMYHSWDGAPQILGLVFDQVCMARALIHAVQYTGDNAHLAVVEDLLATLATHESATHGGYYDIKERDPRFAAVRRQHSTLKENGMAAEVLLRASHLTGRCEYADAAERTLRAFASDYHSYGYHSAAYARAVELWFESPVRVTIVGDADDPKRRALLDEAQRTYVPSRMILTVDPQREPERLERIASKEGDGTHAHVALEHCTVAIVREPGDIARAMLLADRVRR